MMKKMRVTIPFGFRFLPTDEELITFYLLRRAMEFPIIPHANHVLEKQLYGEKADPWLVFEDVDNSLWDNISEGDRDHEFNKDKRVIYVITKLSKISEGKTRIARRAGCGTWSAQTNPKKIFNDSRQWVGTHRMFSFQRSGGHDVVRDPHDQHHWIMHEYSLDGIYSKDRCQIKHQDYVICRIIRVFDKTGCIQESQPILPGKKRSSQVEEEIARSCDKKQKKAISSSSSSGVQQPAGHSMQPDHQFFYDAPMMLSEIPLSSSGSICFDELTQEDLSILNDPMMLSEIPLSSPGSICFDELTQDLSILNDPMMLSEIPLSSPGSICSDELTQEDLSILHDVFGLG